MGERNRPHVEITAQIGCPIRCKYCPQDLLLSRYTGPPRLSMEDFKTICDRIPDHVDIHFSGMCEPFVNPDASDMLEYASKRHRISVFTTLTGLNKAKYDRIREIPYRWFCVHVPDGQLNTKMKCTPEYLELLRYVTENRPECEKFWFSMHGDYHPATIPIIIRFEAENNLIDRAGNLDIPWIKKTEKENPRCTCSDYDQNIVLPDGTVLLCCMDYGMTEILGNLLTQDYESLTRKAGYELCRKCNRSIGE
jgi:hypothetical protein